MKKILAIGVVAMLVLGVSIAMVGAMMSSGDVRDESGGIGTRSLQSSTPVNEDVGPSPTVITKYFNVYSGAELIDCDLRLSNQEYGDGGKIHLQLYDPNGIRKDYDNYHWPESYLNVDYTQADLQTGRWYIRISCEDLGDHHVNLAGAIEVYE